MSFAMVTKSISMHSVRGQYFGEIRNVPISKTYKKTPIEVFIYQRFRCGATEIRTRDTLLGYTRFPGVPLQPLEHRSLLIFLTLFRAANGARTHDLFVTNEMLYQLSYCGFIFANAKILIFL